MEAEKKQQQLNGSGAEPQADEAANKARLSREQRKRLWISRIVMLVCIAAGIGIGLLFARNRPAKITEKVFDADGLRLTLAARFLETGDRSGFDRAYFSNHEQVYTARSPYAAGEGPADLAELAAREAVRISGADQRIQTLEGLCCTEYAAREKQCFAVFYAGSDALWTVVFQCDGEDYAKYRPDFLQFAASAVVP